MLSVIGSHWPRYVIEGVLLGCFMVSALAAVAVVEHPGSAVRRRVGSALARRVIIGIAMGLTAIGLIYSPWGERSGAHMNPAVTLAFAWLGKIGVADTVMYIAAQVIGGTLAVWVCAAAWPRVVRHPSVNCVVTLPRDGTRGAWMALGAEFVISFVLFMAVLVFSNSPRLGGFTGFAAGALVAVYIAFEAPLSGMSINPARTLASAIPAREYRRVWIYLVAPPAAMVLAAVVYASAGRGGVQCCKLSHGSTPCEFGCDHGVQAQGGNRARR